MERIKSSPIRLWALAGCFLILLSALASVLISREAERNRLAIASTSEKTAQGEKIFKKLDRDHDGFLSREEFGDKHESRFDQIDANGDGKIDRDEMRAWYAGREPHGGHAGKGLGRHRGKAAIKELAAAHGNSSRATPAPQ